MQLGSLVSPCCDFGPPLRDPKVGVKDSVHPSACRKFCHVLAGLCCAFRFFCPLHSDHRGLPNLIQLLLPRCYICCILVHCFYVFQPSSLLLEQRLALERSEQRRAVEAAEMTFREEARQQQAHHLAQVAVLNREVSEHVSLVHVQLVHVAYILGGYTRRGCVQICISCGARCNAV